MSADIIKSVAGHTDLKTLSIYTNAADEGHLSGRHHAVGRPEQEQTWTNLGGGLDEKAGHGLTMNGKTLSLSRDS